LLVTAAQVLLLLSMAQFLFMLAVEAVRLLPQLLLALEVLVEAVLALDMYLELEPQVQ
jgi:hypothetical protein